MLLPLYICVLFYLISVYGLNSTHLPVPNLVYTSHIFKQAMCAYVNHARICSWNQPVLSN